MEVRRFTTKQGVQWIKCGWRLGKKRLMTWLITGFLLTLSVLLLGYIPVVGEVVSAFLFPIILCSSILVADSFNNPEGTKLDTGSKRTRGFMASIRYMKHMLFSAFKLEDRILGMMGMAAGMMVFGIVVKILMQLVGGSAINAQAHFWQLSGSQFVSLLSANIVAYILYLILAMSFFYALPLFMLREYDLSSAIKLSLKAVMKNFIPFVAYMVTLASPLIIAIVIAGISELAGFVAMLMAGTLVWVLFLNSMYCSYRLSFK